jgi:hypothetical protein
MYGNAVGSSSSNTMLGGLRTQGNVGAFAKGQAMQNTAGMGLAAEQKNQDLGQQAMQQESELRQKQNSNQAQRANHEVGETLAGEGFRNRQQVFNIGMNYDYAQQARQRQMGYLQALINNSARTF